MDARAIVKKHFILPFAAEGRKNIGTELEFPLINLAKKPVEQKIALGLLEHLLCCGFHVDEYDADGKPAFLINHDGDCVSFDNSYNNFEFAMEKGPSLLAQSKRFSRLFCQVQDYLLPRGHLLCGMGTNPYYPYLDKSPVNYPVYGIIRQFLGQFRGGNYHNWPEFPAYLSSVQTHLDVPLALLPRSLTLFAALDFVRALLFSNSPSFTNGFDDTVCFRDYLWEKSGFSSLHANIGKVEGSFQTEHDIENLMISRSLFYRIRNGTYELIKPVTLEEYFSHDNSREEDIHSYLSFQNVEITRRGTLEVRSDCQQPAGEGFCAPAFHLGLFCGIHDAETLLYNFFAQCLPKEIASHPHRNQILRDEVVYHYRIPAPAAEVQKLLCALVDLAHQKLVARGMGEEILLLPLHQRAQKLTCPAREQKKLAKHGVSMEEIIQKFSIPNG